MKKRLLGFAFCIVLLVTATMNLGTVKAMSIESENKLALLLALDEHLKTADSYYQKGSATFIDGIDLDGTVRKILKADDPRTEENEEVVEEYPAKIAVALVEFNQIRDRIFAFKKTDFYYYDLEKQEFLKANDVFINEEIKSFFLLNMDQINKELTTFANILLLMLISTIIIIPLLIMIFHNQGRSTTNYILNE